VFYVFNSQEEQRKFLCNSAFIEIRFCKMPFDTKIKKVIARNSIKDWRDDSLYIYVDDIDTFFNEYSSFFACGTYNNSKSGIVDIFGVNYYKPDLIDNIAAMILESKPTDYEILIEWLYKAKNFNGFYILGI